MLAAFQRKTEPPAVAVLHAMIRKLLEGPASAKPADPAPLQLPAQFAWTEYEQLMVSEAVHRGEYVYNVALRIDSQSLMRAAAFQLIRNVLHGCGTVIGLRPEDNVGAAVVEIVEALLGTRHSVEHIAQRCQIPAVVADVRVEVAQMAEAVEHELLGELLEAQAQAAAQAVATEEDQSGTKPAGR